MSGVDKAADASRCLLIVNKKGLHARAAAKFARLAASFDADVQVSRLDMSVPGTSIMGLMMLGAGLGSEIYLRAKGPQAEMALDALAALVSDRFEEDE